MVRYNSKNLPPYARRLSRKKAYVRRRRLKREMQERAALEAIANSIKSESIESINSFMSPEAMSTKEINTLETYLGTKPMDSKEMNTLETYLGTKPMDSKEMNTLETYLGTKPMDSKEMNTLETYLDIKPNKDTYENIRICEGDVNDTLAINDKILPGIDHIQEHEPEGDRIINISFFLREMHRLFDGHAPGFECKFKDWILINSRRRGLLTQFFFKCQTCSYEANFWSHPTDKKVFLISTAITASNQNSKIGINAELKKQFAAVNLPCLNGKIDIRQDIY
ncbi:uncharacterized protein [Mycetomoellerius zeteki]|uniref:uncharacterized protein isoform X3 n=1 Tax=Mycetomoellerius zeteki TaxID=64791 RepID=UPI00084E7F32|nr:PREDICTED: uncharacterized protein LOC108730010 isoform X3 [Trachymyrmex zeteki]